MAAEILDLPTLPGYLLPGGLRRGLLRPELPRDPKFVASYEDRILFYDAFWDVTGRQIIVHGPLAIDLKPHYRQARYVARPSGAVLKPKPHHSTRVELYGLKAPPDTTHLEVTFAGHVLTLPVGESYARHFAGENLLFTLSRNNDLDWIADWARFHVVNQGVTAVLLFDNASDRYGLDDIAARLAAIEGLRKISVIPVPHRYTDRDEAMRKTPFWAHFLQPSMMLNMFRRYGPLANGILNCDIDELAVPTGDETVFETARASRSGTVYFRGRWIEPVPGDVRADGYRHADFRLIKPGTDITRGRTTQKWAVDPDRKWLKNLSIHPHTHLFANRPWFTRHKPTTAYIAHFRAISTSWARARPVTPERPPGLIEDTLLSRALDRAFPELAARGRPAS